MIYVELCQNVSKREKNMQEKDKKQNIPDAAEKFVEYISIHGITRKDVDLYIRKYPMSTFKYYYELELDHVLA